MMPKLGNSFDQKHERFNTTEDERDRSPHPYSYNSIRGLRPAQHASSLENKHGDAGVPCRDAAGVRSPELSEPDTDSDSSKLSRALPAPQRRPSKGLRLPGTEHVGQDGSPFLTPSQLHDTVTDRPNYFDQSSNAQVAQDDGSSKASTARGRFFRRRRAELLRRGAELLSVTLLCVVTMAGSSSREEAKELAPELASCPTIVAVLLVLYPISVLWHSFANGKRRFGGIKIPSTFDPAPLLYPPLIPILVSLSLFGVGSNNVLSNNIVLGLSALPRALFPLVNNQETYSTFHWISTLVPLMTRFAAGLDREGLALLYPLQQSLACTLHFLTTTSLLPAELQLMSTALINLLLHSTTPQARMLCILLWIGGLGLFIVCGKVFRTIVALERIPTRRARRGSRDKSTADTDDITSGLEVTPAALKRSLTNSLSGDQYTANGSSHSPSDQDSGLHRSRWSTATKKMVLHIYAYCALAGIIIWPVRIAIRYALHGWEPVGWAIAYLLGGISPVRSLVDEYDLHDWIPLGPLPASSQAVVAANSPSWVDRQRFAYGQANVRLALFAYWALVISAGLLIVLKLLPKMAEVDTRRKVFHGMMVVMLLPTAYVDPCFLSLGLVMVLAVFLLLDLLRASQLQPISRPLANFLTPYVDGRDLRGPVIVSHMFLLIGCAIPFWLSLAAYDRPGPSTFVQSASHKADPWAGWELQDRDLSMVAGVVCVGMGDAAASLIGRRFGKRKWPWAGGKSLEGSAAFAAAVVIGLMLGKLWMQVGGWQPRRSFDGHTMSTALAKMCIAACGASFTEAVLTGANDNVVVPIVLWLLLRGLAI